MTNEELVRLIQSHVNESENMGLLYKQNERFIYNLTLPYSKRAEIEDLMQEAYFGLQKAAYGYDTSKGVAFLTYASYKIQAVIQRYCFNNSLTKRIPIHILETIHKYHSFRKKYFDINNEYPDDELVMKHLHIGKKRLMELKQIIHSEQCQSLNDVIPGTEGLTIEDGIADEINVENEVVYSLTANQINQGIWEAVNELDARSSEIITGIYKNGKTQLYYSELFKISNQMIGILQKKALKELKHNKKIKEAARFYDYDYDSFISYHWGVSAFKNTFTSGTEIIALKHIKFEELIKGSNLKLQEIMKV